MWDLIIGFIYSLRASTPGIASITALEQGLAAPPFSPPPAPATPEKVLIVNILGVWVLSQLLNLQ